MFSLKGKVAVITGGGSGIGKAISICFAKQGAIVNIVEINPANAEDTLAEIRSIGGNAAVQVCDVSDADQVQSLFTKIGSVDILVNNAGIAHVGSILNTSKADMDRVIGVNIGGVFNCLQAVIPMMKAQQKGVILNMCSIAASVGISDRFAYSMSKGAVLAMSQSVARDFIADNIRCNTISPARIHTPFVDGFLQKHYPGKEEEMFEKLSKSQPIGRMGTTEEVAALALYLCSDEASFITGNDYLIDGGFTKLNN